MRKIGPKLKSKKDHRRDAELRLVADEFAAAMMSADLGHILESGFTMRMTGIWARYAELAEKYA